MPLRKSGVEPVIEAEAAMDFLAVMAEGAVSLAPAPTVDLPGDASTMDHDRSGARAIDPGAPSDAAPLREGLPFWLVAGPEPRMGMSAEPGEGPSPPPSGAPGRLATTEVADLIPQAQTVPGASSPNPPAPTTEPGNEDLPPQTRKAGSQASAPDSAVPIRPSMGGGPTPSSAVAVQGDGSADSWSDARKPGAAKVAGQNGVVPAGDEAVPRLPAGPVSGPRGVAEAIAAERLNALREGFVPPVREGSRPEIPATAGKARDQAGAAPAPAASQTSSTGTGPVAPTGAEGAPRISPRVAEDAFPDLQGSAGISQMTEAGEEAPPSRQAWQAEPRASRPEQPIISVAAAWPVRPDGQAAPENLPAFGNPSQDVVRMGPPRQMIGAPPPGIGATTPPAPPVDGQKGAESASDPLPIWAAAPEEAVAALNPEAAEARKPTERPLAAAAPPSEAARGVAVQLAAAVSATSEGMFEIKLSPEELGRVTVTLQVTDDAVVLAVQAERQETLDLMRRHADILQREFREAGFTSLSFSFGQGPADGRSPGSPAAEATTEDSPSVPQTPLTPHQATGAAPASRLDLRL
jgi:hypothetical protein